MAFFQEIVRLLLSPYPKKTLKAQQIGIRRAIKYIQGGSLALTDEMLCHLRYTYESVLGWLGDRSRICLLYTSPSPRD